MAVRKKDKEAQRPKLQALPVEVTEYPPGPVRKVTRNQPPEPASPQAIAVTMLRKHQGLYRDHAARRGELTHLLYESETRTLTDAEAEYAITEIRKLKGPK